MEFLLQLLVLALIFGACAFGFHQVKSAFTADWVAKEEHKLNVQRAHVKELTQVHLTDFGAFVIQHGKDPQWYPVPTTVQQPLNDLSTQSRANAKDYRMRAIEIIQQSGKLYPDDKTRIATQRDMTQATGMSPVIHSETLNWLADNYGLQVTEGAPTYCGVPYPDRDKLYNAVIARVGEKPTPPSPLRKK